MWSLGSGECQGANVVASPEDWKAALVAEMALLGV